MNKITVPSLMLMLMGFFASNVHAELVWTTGSCAPSEWTALPDNLLDGAKGTISGNIEIGYSTNDPMLLTDGDVPQVGTADEVHPKEVGFKGNASVVWTFAAPKTLEQVRISCGYPVLYNNYSGLRVKSVEMQTFGSSTWMPFNAATGEYADNGQNAIQWLVLSNENGGPLAEGVGALKVIFDSPISGLANYCGEIEAVGRAGAVGPTIGSVDVTPAKTKAIFSGSIADAGTDATMCNVYLSINGATPVRIAKRVTDTFEYCLEGLETGTTYSYLITISNDAPTVKDTVKSGQFMTLAADARTTMWITSEGVPDDFVPIENNVLSGMVGTTTGTISGYGGGVDLLTNAEVSGETKQTCGFYEGATVAWSFDKPKSLKSIRFTTCFTASYGMYDDIKISKIEIKTADFDYWIDLDVEELDYAGSGTSGTALFASLHDFENGFVVRNATALRITFGKPNNVAQYYAEIEAVEYVYVPDRKPGFSVIVR